MYKKTKANKTSLRVNKSYEGESIEHKINRIVNNKEPIKDGAPLIYTDRKDGVKAEYDIRTDRFEVALEAMGAVDKTYKAQREQRIGERTFDTMNQEEQTNFNKKYPTNKHNKAGSQGTKGNEGTPANSTD